MKNKLWTTMGALSVCAALLVVFTWGYTIAIAVL